MRTSAGKLMPPSTENARRASMTSPFSSAIRSFESVASFVRNLSDISDRNDQNFSTGMGALIDNRKRHSDVATTPALERTLSNFPGSAKRNASGESGAEGGEETY